MDDYSVQPGTVDPEVRAYVYSLVTALGGTGAEEDGRYILGDDALACLKDIKRWLKLHDEKLHRLDVARCLAEANLVKGDLLEILGSWPEDEGEDIIRAKIALACLELLVPLTWPLEKEELQTTANHYQHMPYLQLAQIGYKREIFEHWSSSILRTSIRIGLPSIALPIGERSQRDEGIIKLLLYFLRNIVMISAPPDLPVEWNENEVSRSATINAYHTQDVFALILTVASNIGEDFNTQDVVVLEVLFHLLKGINVERLFMDDEQVDQKNTKDLQNLMNKEASMLRSYAKNAPSRHSRFGTMIWVHREDGKVSTLSGQDALRDCATAFAKMDQSKKWNKPRRGPKEPRTSNHCDIATPISKSAKPLLQSFVEDFLDSGFNPLFSHLRKTIEREAERALEMHTQQFLYLTGWFLEAARYRIANTKKARASEQTPKPAEAEVENYGLVAAVLNQETFILLNRYMQERLDTKAWHELDAGMRCFTQILLTVQDMSLSSNDEDQEIAENIQNRLFYEETTHDRVLTILRGYKDQGFSYLDACTELAHVFLRILERYSKENIDLQIRSRRKARKKKQAATENREQGQDIDQNSEDEDEIEAQRTSRERKFDFQRFAARFITQPCVDTFVSFATYYKDLSTEQLKRAHRFFYRVGFKQDMCIMLFRLDIISLFNRMIKGSEPLNDASPMFADWQELIKQIFKRLIKKMKERPELAVELLFSKVPATAFYLEYGYDKQAVTGTPRAPAELEVKENMSREEQIGIVVAAMFRTNFDAVMFVEEALGSAANERQSWEAEAAARSSEAPNESTTQSQDGEPSGVPSQTPQPPSIVLKPKSEPIRLALFKNARLRLLLTLVGLERLGEADDPDATWLFPPHLTSTDLKRSAWTIQGHRMNPSAGYGDDGSIAPEDMLRRKRAPREQATHLDSIGIGRFDNFIESDSEIDALEAELEAAKENAEFPAGGPTSRKSSALEQLKKKRRLRKRTAGQKGEEGEEGTLFVDGNEDELDAEAEKRRAKRKARLLNDLERRRKIKSTEFVHSSDEEDDVDRDREFFEAEKKRRVGQKNRVREILLHEDLEDGKGKERGKKRKSEGDTEGKGKKRRVDSDDESNVSLVDGAEDEDLGMAALSSSSPRQRANIGTSEVGGESDTPLSSQTEGDAEVGHGVKDSAGTSRALRIQSGPFADDEDESEAEPDPPNQDGRQPLIEVNNPKAAPIVEQMEADKGGEDYEEDVVSSNKIREQRRRIVVLDHSDDD